MGKAITDHLRILGNVSIVRADISGMKNCNRFTLNAIYIYNLKREGKLDCTSESANQAL
jgi:hypothetical protein